MGDHGFLDKPEDSSGLTAVGARLYDAVLGVFVSVDPVMDLADPQQWNAYVYANNNPMTFSDPTGLLLGPLIDGAYTAPTRGKPGSGGWQVGPNNTGYTGSWNNGGAGKWSKPGTTYTPPVTIRRDPAADQARAQAAAAAKAKAQAEAHARAAAEQRAREHAAAEAEHKKNSGIGEQVGGWLSDAGNAIGSHLKENWRTYAAGAIVIGAAAFTIACTAATAGVCAGSGGIILSAAVGAAAGVSSYHVGTNADDRTTAGYVSAGVMGGIPAGGGKVYGLLNAGKSGTPVAARYLTTAPRFSPRHMKPVVNHWGFGTRVP